MFFRASKVLFIVPDCKKTKKNISKKYQDLEKIILAQFASCTVTALF